jgi:hypothetical protein
MTKDKALELALEALESAVRYHGIMLMSDPPQDAWKYHRVENKADKAIKALEEALAKQEQGEPVCPECKAGVLYECVACSSNNYPPQRTWVGLTDEEIAGEFYKFEAAGAWYQFALAIEAKLKEKNT